MSHTILIVQPGQSPETRTYFDYNSVDECLQGVCTIYEEHLKRRHPHKSTITYGVKELLDFIDTLVDVTCMVHQKSTNTYAPYNKQWIKDKMYVLLLEVVNEKELEELIQSNH